MSALVKVSSWNQPVCGHFYLFGFSRSASSFISPTWPDFVPRHRYLQTAGSGKKAAKALAYLVSSSPSLVKWPLSCNIEVCFCFLSGCFFTPCRSNWLLVVWHHLKSIECPGCTGYDPIMLWTVLFKDKLFSWRSVSVGRWLDVKGPCLLLKPFDKEK